jgi:hypothetical protein
MWSKTADICLNFAPVGSAFSLQSSLTQASVFQFGCCIFVSVCEKMFSVLPVASVRKILGAVLTGLAVWITERAVRLLRMQVFMKL